MGVSKYDNNDHDLLESEKERLNSVRQLLDYIHEIFPIVYSTKDVSLYERLYSEIGNDHLIMKLNNEINDTIRYAYYFEFFTLINVTLMMTAMVTSIEVNDDDGTCITFVNKDDCLHEKSMYEY